MDKYAERLIASRIADFLNIMSKRLPDDVYDALCGMRERESNPVAQSVYDCMFENISEAVRLDRPICQDTGIVQFFVKVGAKFPYISEIKSALTDAVKSATKDVPLRPNAIEPFTEKNTGDNVAAGSPWIEWEIVPEVETLTVEIYLAGGGCSLPGKAVVLMPSAGYEGVAKIVLDAVCERGINACPPLIIGVGIASCADAAGVLSKRALLRQVGSANPLPQAAELEVMLKDAVNSIGIGPNALTGTESVIGVHVEYAAHHPATLAVGVSFGCWASRHGVIEFDSGLNFRILSHGVLSDI